MYYYQYKGRAKEISPISVIVDVPYPQKPNKMWAKFKSQHWQNCKEDIDVWQDLVERTTLEITFEKKLNEEEFFATIL